MTTDFEALYASMPRQAGKQWQMNIASAIEVFYGVSHDGYLRLAFLCKTQPPSLVSTKVLRIVEGEESPGVHWLCFDLLNVEVKSAFFAFCSNMLEAVCEASSEPEALVKLKRRYSNWKTLFKNTPSSIIDKDKVQGLFGELYFLKDHMLNTYGADAAVLAWGGPEATSKDFAINTTWYEVKTIGALSANVTISSLAQLSSPYPGHLVVIKVERMPIEFSNGASSISEILAFLLDTIQDEAIEAALLEKVSSYGVSTTDEAFALKFDVKSLRQYRVEPGFPRITLDDAPYPEITDASYKISVAAIERFAEG